MSIGATLEAISSSSAYDSRQVMSRWGQILRESPTLARLMEDGRSSGKLIRLEDLTQIRGGVVTRANAYFLVEEVPFDSVPESFGVTRNDYRRVAVIEDGIGGMHRIEREHLNPIIKGPEMLVSPTAIASTSDRLLAVRYSKEELKKKRHTGVLEYLKRGETVSYNVSSDSLKGGIPAKRSQIKNRKPWWFSLSIPSINSARLVIPEHFDSRFVVTLVEPGNQSTVIDKLFVAKVEDSEHAEFILASLNSLLTWYQMEVSGRTQLGQGVLELKKPEVSGLLVANPNAFSQEERTRLVEAFEPLRSIEAEDFPAVVGTESRVTFDTTYLELLVARDPVGTRLKLERELRAAASERREKKASIAEERRKRGKSAIRKISQEAYASRVIALVPKPPDPRDLVKDEWETTKVQIDGPVEGTLSVGSELFTQGQVFAGDQVVASLTSDFEARFVLGVLLRDRTVREIRVPQGEQLGRTVRSWEEEWRKWKDQFDATLGEVTDPIGEERVVEQVRQQAMVLLGSE